MALLSPALALIACAVPLICAVFWIKKSKRKIWIVLGSGGHTNEMIRLISRAEFPQNMDVLFVIGNADKLSLVKAQQWLGETKRKAHIIPIQRPRDIHQPLVCAVPNILKCFCQCSLLAARHVPGMILTNGPAISVIASMAARFVLTVDIQPKVIYVESFARVRTLSRSGAVMQYIASRFYVQWPYIASKRGLFAAERKYGTGPLV